jgi:hypothetical protein
MRLLATLVAGVLLCQAIPAVAVPQGIPYTGRLSYESGAPYQGTAAISVALYSSAEGSDVVWAPFTFNGVEVSGGVFGVVLGGGGSPPVSGAALASAELWIQFTVNGTPLAPRQRVLSVPYALEARNAQQLGGIQASAYAKSGDLSAVATSGSYADLTNKPTLAPVATSGSYADLTNKPTLAPVATSGSYADLTNKPTLAPVATSGSYADLSNKPALAAVATSGDYNALVNKPNLSGFLTTTGAPAATTINSTTVNATTVSATTTTSGNASATTVTANSTLSLARGGLMTFGAGSCPLPTGFSADTSSSTDGFCMRTGTPGGDAETLFLMGYDNGDSAEAVYIGGGLNCCGPDWLGLRVQANGNAQLSGTLNTNQGALYSDLAEHLPASAELEAGDVVVAAAVDGRDFGRSWFEPSYQAYDRAVVGVVSDTAGLAMGPSEGRRPVALSGIVKVKVDADFGAVAPGDLLVSSDTPGHAMRASRDIPGTVIGKALEPLRSGRGTVLMLVMNR